jgi:hypothetical protein
MFFNVFVFENSLTSHTPLRQLFKNHREGCIGGDLFFGLGAKYFECKDESRKPAAFEKFF